MIFKNEKELERFLMSKCQIAIKQAQEHVYRILDKFLNDFYDDYDPTTYVDWDGTRKIKRGYDRTYQLLRSLVKSEVIPSKKGYQARVYFDLNGLSYNGYNPTGEQVMAAASQGLHGAIGKMPRTTPFGNDEFMYVQGNTGVSVWNDPIKILDAEAINILRDMLIAEGIPLSKK